MSRKKYMNLKEFVAEMPYEFNNMVYFINEAYLDDSPYKYSLPSTDTQFVQKTIDSDFYLAFRGTESFKDLMNDLNFGSVTFAYDNQASEIRLYDGFYYPYRSVRSEIINRLHESKSKRVFISGHSLGGALAVLCAVDIHYNFPHLRDKIFLMTVGQPAVGNRAFAQSTDNRLNNYFRIVNGNDFVPKFPPSMYHCGQLTEIGNKHWWKPISIDDHMKVNYIRPLLSMTENP